MSPLEVSGPTKAHDGVFTDMGEWNGPYWTSSLEAHQSWLEPPEWAQLESHRSGPGDLGRRRDWPRRLDPTQPPRTAVVRRCQVDPGGRTHDQRRHPIIVACAEISTYDADPLTSSHDRWTPILSPPPPPPWVGDNPNEALTPPNRRPLPPSGWSAGLIPGAWSNSLDSHKVFRKNLHVNNNNRVDFWFLGEAYERPPSFLPTFSRRWPRVSQTTRHGTIKVWTGPQYEGTRIENPTGADEDGRPAGGLKNGRRCDEIRTAAALNISHLALGKKVVLRWRHGVWLWGATEFAFALSCQQPACPCSRKESQRNRI